MLKLKKANTKMVMYQRPFFAKGCGAWFFGRKPGSLWNDERVRQALALQMDADLWGDTSATARSSRRRACRSTRRGSRTAGPGYNWWLDPSTEEQQAGRR